MTSPGWEATSEYIQKSNNKSMFLSLSQLKSKNKKRKDYYRILGVDRKASEDEIKSPYWKWTLMHHMAGCRGASERQSGRRSSGMLEKLLPFSLILRNRPLWLWAGPGRGGHRYRWFDANIVQAFVTGPGPSALKQLVEGIFFPSTTDARKPYRSQKMQTCSVWPWIWTPFTCSCPPCS